MFIFSTLSRSVQLVARIKTLVRESFVHQDARYNMNLPFLMRAFPNACLLYQLVIDTRCEACAIKRVK